MYHFTGRRYLPTSLTLYEERASNEHGPLSNVFRRPGVHTTRGFFVSVVDSLRSGTFVISPGSVERDGIRRIQQIGGD